MSVEQDTTHSVTKTNGTRKVDKTQLREITLEEVNLHDGRPSTNQSERTTIWVAIRNNVYDITDLVPVHPGGPVIRMAFGREATCLFEGYHWEGHANEHWLLHSDKVRHIGVVAKHQQLPDSALDNRFFLTVRKRVQDHLKNIQLPIHGNEWIASLEVVLTILLYLYFTYALVMTGTLWSAIGVGVVTGRCGMLMHTGTHKGSSKHHFWNLMHGGLMDLAGGSSLTWSITHLIAHHSYPNEPGKDNDCDIAYPYARLHPTLKWHPINRWNSVFFVLGMTFGSFTWIFLDFIVMYNGREGSTSFFPKRADIAYLGVFKVFFLMTKIFLPIYYYGWYGFLLFTILGVIYSYYAGTLFLLNHFQWEAARPPLEAHWAVRQTASTCDWAPQNMFWNWVSGGLSHQVEHHVMPCLSFWVLPHIQPIVKQTCKDFGVPYYSFPTFSTAFSGMFSYLNRLGAGES